MVKLLAYVFESAVLAGMYWVSAVLMAVGFESRMDRRLWNLLRWFLWIFILVLSLNVFFTETWGPDHILLHKIALAVLPAAAVASLFALGRSLVRRIRRG